MDEHGYVYMPDVILGNPHTQRGRSCIKRLNIENVLDSEFFFKYLYTPSRFEQAGGLQPSTSTSVDNDVEEYPFNDKNVDFKNTQQKKKRFESLFFSYTSDPMLYIRGASGTGKSTYLNWLMWVNRGNEKIDVQHILLDLEDMRSLVNEAGMEFRPPNESVPWLFVCYILHIIYRYTWDILKSNNYERLKNINLTYSSMFSKNGKTNDSIEALFGVLQYQHHSAPSLNKHLFKALLRLINRKRPVTTIKDMLRVFAIILYCDAQKPNDTKRKFYILSFDNIEYYIPEVDNKCIYDVDIQIIASSIANFIKSCSVNFRDVGVSFEEYFKFILVIRDTTSKMLHTSIHERHHKIDSCSIDISKWFDYYEIYKRRMEYVMPLVESKGGSINQNQKTYFDVISNDTMSKTEGNNLIEMVSSMFSYSKRRVATALDSAANVLDNIIGSSDIISKDVFFRYWRMDNAYPCKYLCRRSIIQILLNNIANKGYWHDLQLEGNNNNEIRTYARRVLIFLSRRFPIDPNRSDKDEYVSFYELLNGIFATPLNSKPELNYDSQIKPLAMILCALNRWSYDITNWSQLIVIKYNANEINHKFDEVALAEKLRDSWNAFTNNSKSLERYFGAKRFGVKITDAGRFFTYIQCDYIFFASRNRTENEQEDNYYDQTPLIFLKDVLRINTIIKTVYKKAISCIDRTIRFEKDFFSNHTRSKYSGRNMVPERYFLFLRIDNHGIKHELTHPERILYNHHLFLVHYRKFIESFSSDVFTNAEKIAILKTVNIYINEYSKKFNLLKADGYIDSSATLYNPN